MPMHTGRIWNVAGPFGPAQLADRLAKYSWTLCSGFECLGYLYLNDSTSEDALQEYAVVRKSDLVQVESITVSWMEPEVIAGFAETVGDRDPHTYGSIKAANLEHDRLDYCERCA